MRCDRKEHLHNIGLLEEEKVVGGAVAFHVEPLRWGIMLAAGVKPEVMLTERAEDIAAVPVHVATIQHFPTPSVIMAANPHGFDFRQLWAWWVSTQHHEALTALSPERQAAGVPEPLLQYLLRGAKLSRFIELVPTRAAGAPDSIPITSSLWSMQYPGSRIRTDNVKAVRRKLGKDTRWGLDVRPETSGMLETCKTCRFCMPAHEFDRYWPSDELVCSAWVDNTIPSGFITRVAVNPTWQMCFSNRLCPYYADMEGRCAAVYRRWKLASQ